MMRVFTSLGVGLILFFAASGQVSAHSLKSLENQLHNKDKYFQPLDKEAPKFTLQDADCQSIGTADRRSKVVVLHFVYTDCPDVGSLHAARQQGDGRAALFCLIHNQSRVAHE